MLGAHLKLIHTGSSQPPGGARATQTVRRRQTNLRLGTQSSTRTKQRNPAGPIQPTRHPIPKRPHLTKQLDPIHAGIKHSKKHTGHIGVVNRRNTDCTHGNTPPRTHTLPNRTTQQTHPPLWVHGLNVREKRTRLLQDLKHYRASIVFLQETHFQEGRAPALRDRNFRTGYFRNNPDRRKLGVGILFSSRTPYTEQATVRCKQGRYIFTKGTILEQTYMFANIYAPNTKQFLFLRNALNTLMKFAEGTMIVGGDLNLTPHPDQDSTSALGKTPHNRHANKLRLLHQHQLADCWRALNPTTRDYTFYSQTHATYTRLDYFLIAHHNLALLKAADILPMTWSDHCPIRIRMTSPLFKPRQMSWRLNESILSDVTVTDKIGQIIRDYFQDNETEDVTPMTCWEAHKTVVRGQIIAICANPKKTAVREITRLSGEIATLEARHKRTLETTIYRELTDKRNQLTAHLNRKIQRAYQQYRHMIHKHGDKCGRLLANLLRQRRTQLYIPKIKNAQQQIRHLPDQIAAEFQ
ncbi:Hypothetical predicted protein [Pelobates cultripes]|uniref:exodeoxyribonuclease III n=1 Tax=Pelobates cultripes TaxID=61616 RepID=A0AAD1R403_PELCU|nr:Hypothetical predicted protein [Pelobates cultripes]